MRVFVSMETHNSWSVFFLSTKDYITAFKLFTAVCCNGWRGKEMDTSKKLAFFSSSSLAL